MSCSWDSSASSSYCRAVIMDGKANTEAVTGGHRKQARAFKFAVVVEAVVGIVDVVVVDEAPVYCAQMSWLKELHDKRIVPSILASRETIERSVCERKRTGTS